MLDDDPKELELEIELTLDEVGLADDDELEELELKDGLTLEEVGLDEDDEGLE